MNFAEVRFWVVLLSSLTVILVLRTVSQARLGDRITLFDKVALISLGLVLLLCVSWVTFLIFLLVAGITYVGLWWVLQHDPNRQTRYLFVLIPLQLLPLLYYKYADFLLNQVLSFDFPGLRRLVIPVGISFYTFQKVAFVVDTLAAKKPLPRFLDYMNFAGFFPQIVAGPIERQENLLPQMQHFRLRWNPEAINEGATWIAVGLFFKCCLADNLAAYFDASSVSNPFLIWLANVVFGLRIYYDFAGYSLVAVGLGRCLGVTLTLNFLSPYCATSIVEFWRRWHVTLSQWFRDYVYVPLGGGRTTHWMFTVALVFVVSGVWHGAGWNFILWGVLHGTYLIVNRLVRVKVPLPALLGWVLTVVATFYAWLCFYERRTSVLLAKLKTLGTLQAYGLGNWRDAMAQWVSGNGIVLGGFLLLAALVLGLEWFSVARKNEPYYILRRPSVAMVLVALTVLLAPGKNNAFIYFAF